MTNVRCIYCTTTARRTRRGEHILLAGLGGTTCISHVCGQCNQRLGDELDRKFLRSSSVALARALLRDGPDGLLAEPQFLEIPEWRGFVDCTYHTVSGLAVHSQVFFRDGNVVQLVADPAADKVDRFLAATTPETLRALHAIVDDRPQHHPPRLVIRVQNNRASAFIRARTTGDYEDLLRKLGGASLPVATPGSPFVPPTTLGVRFTIDPNVLGRCAAKMSMNFACHALGPEAVLASTLDPLRRYVLGDDVVEGPGVTEDGEEGALTDMRFLQESPYEPKTRAVHPTDKRWHAISIYVRDSVLYGEVMLFGGVISIRPRLGRVAIGDFAPWVLVRELDEDQDNVMTEPPPQRLRAHEAK